MVDATRTVPQMETGDREKARQLDAQLLANCRTRLTGRGEVSQARDYVAKGS